MDAGLELTLSLHVLVDSGMTTNNHADEDNWYVIGSLGKL